MVAAVLVNRKSQNWSALLPAHEVQIMAHHVHQAQLHGSLGKHRLNGIGETFHAIQAGDEDIPHAPVLSFSHQLQPKLCAFRLHRPQAHYLFHTLQVDANGQVQGLSQSAPLP